MSGIPISQVANVVPQVVGTGGNPLSLNNVLLSESAYASVSQLQQFTAAQGAAAVGALFGLASAEYLYAGNYFKAFDQSSTVPQALFIAGYAAAAVPGYQRSASLAGVTLAQLQAISGSLSVTIAGTVFNAAALNLSTATSFTNAAAMIATALTIGAAGSVTWDPNSSTFLIQSATAGAAETISAVTGTAAQALGFSGGGVTQQGAAADSPAGAMNRIAGQSLNWATFTLAWVTGTAGQALNLAFIAWVNQQQDGYEFICWDNDPGYATPNNAETLGAQLAITQPDGVSLWPSLATAGAIAGGIAAINWNALNGRQAVAFKSQAGLTPDVTSTATYNAYLSNLMNSYAQFAARGNANIFNVFQTGAIPGRWKWLDSYVNQIFMNSQFALGIFTGLQSVNTAPYNDQGDAYIRSWMAPTVTQALNNGTIRKGVTLSAAQINAITAAAGLDISTELFANGYYIQILTATAQVRGARTSPPINFWYCDGGSIQSISLASIAVL